MNIGILYEGRYDKDPIIEILKLIFDEIQCPIPITFMASEAGGSILPKMDSSAVLFFENSTKCDIALYMSDTDYNPRKKAVINQWISNYCRLNPQGNIIAGHPQPYLEQWFLNDPDSIRKTFGLPNESALPFNEIINPKDRFISIIEFLNHDKSKGRTDLYTEVASNISLQRLSKIDPSCKSFYKNMKQALRNLCGDHTH